MALRKFSCQARSQSSSVVSRNGLAGGPPAFGTQTSTCPKRRMRRLHKGAHRRGIGDVEGLGVGLDAKAAPGVRRDLIELLLAARAQRQVRTLGRECQSGGPADARARSGNHGDSAFQSRVHAPYDSRGSNGRFQSQPAPERPIWQTTKSCSTPASTRFPSNT